MRLAVIAFSVSASFVTGSGIVDPKQALMQLEVIAFSVSLSFVTGSGIVDPVQALVMPRKQGLGLGNADRSAARADEDGEGGTAVDRYVLRITEKVAVM